MTDQEMIAILEEIALDPDAYPTSRVTAIRTLWEWRRNELGERPSAFDELYGDELRARRRAAARKRTKRR
jgi:hypothetical protein